MKTILVGENANDIFLFADSAAGRDSMPLFIPEGEWMGELRMAFRIGLLGKGISPAFAARYMADWGAVLLMRPVDGKLPGWLGIMDSAVTIGKWASLEQECSLKAFMPDGKQEEIGPFPLEAAIQAVSLSSKRATLKTGDIIIPHLESIRFPLVPDTRIEVFANESPTLKVKIK